MEVRVAFDSPPFWSFSKNSSKMEATVILIKLTEQKFSVLFSYNLAVHLLLFWRIYFNWKVAALEFQWGSNPVLLTHISLVFERHSYKKKFTKLCAKYIEECQWNTQIVCVRKWKELIRGAFEPSGTSRGIAHLVISTTFGPGAGKMPLPEMLYLKGQWL